MITVKSVKLSPERRRHGQEKQSYFQLLISETRVLLLCRLLFMKKVKGGAIAGIYSTSFLLHNRIGKCMNHNLINCYFMALPAIALPAISF